MSCISLNTYLLTNNGLKKLSDIFKDKNIVIDNSKSSYKINLKICNKNGKLENVKYINNNGIKNLYYLQTSNGLTIETTKDHIFFILNKEGIIVPKRFEELKENDLLISRKEDKISNDKELITPDNAYLLGVLYSLDFLNLIKTNHNNILLPIENIEIKETIRQDLINNFELTIEKEDYYIYNNKMCFDIFIKNYNFSNQNISDKILNSNINIQFNFLKGFFDINTNIKDDKIYKKIENKEIMIQLILLMKNIGIIAEIKVNYLIIKQSEIVNFYNLIGFNNIKLENDILNISLNESDFYAIDNIKNLINLFYESVKDSEGIPTSERNGRHAMSTDSEGIPTSEGNGSVATDSIHHKSIEYNKLSFKFTKENIYNLLTLNGNIKLKELIIDCLNNHICFEKITYISDIYKKDYVFDFNMNDSNTYIANSFISYSYKGIIS